MIEESRDRLLKSGIPYNQAQMAGVGIIDALPVIRQAIEDAKAEERAKHAAPTAKAKTG